MFIIIIFIGDYMYKKYELKYNYDELEPYIDTRTVAIHYQNHYMKYLNKLNELLLKEGFKFDIPKEELINNIDMFDIESRDDILYNLGGVLNHELYFDNINKNTTLEPVGKLKDAITSKYGSYENFKKEFKNKTKNLIGSGYTNLVLDKSNNLEIINTSNQDTPYSYGFIPIMTIDLWEHAYYLKYQNNKELYVDNFFNLIDFDVVEKNYEKAIS